MVRPSKSAEIDLSRPHELTAGLIERLRCPSEKAQAFMRDSKAPALRVRVTVAGAKSFVFEAKLNRATVRRTIGDVRSWSIDAARIEANRVRVLVDSGTDPRELERLQTAERNARKALDSAEAATVQEAWDAYLAVRKARWGARHYADHVAKAKAGGVKAKRGTRGRGETIAGPLHPLMPLKLRDLSPALVGAWAAEQTKVRPTAARLSWRLLKGLRCARPGAATSCQSVGVRQSIA